MRALWPLVFLLVACDGAFETSHGGVDRGGEALLENKPAEAKAAFDEAAGELPESPELDFDRGLALSATGDQPQAIDTLLRALRPAPDDADRQRDEAKAQAQLVLRQRVNAALGLAHAKAALALEKQAPAPSAPDPKDPSAPKPDEKKDDKAAEGVMSEWKLAVSFLEDALRDKPDDLESRRTLEVALLRVDPPCSARDDKYEENDVAGVAKLLEPKAPAPEQTNQSGGEQPPPPDQSGAADELKLQEQLFSCPDDDDWYALNLEAGDRVSVTLTVPADKGKLSLTLESPSGEVVGTGPTLKHTVAPNEAGKWLVAVKNIELDEVSYGLEVKVRPRCDKTEDRFEDNDSSAQAKLLTPGALSDLKLCPTDEDWYAVDLAEGESLFLFAQAAPDPDKKAAPKPAPNQAGQPEPPPEPPPFALEIRDTSGKVLNSAGPSGDALVATLLTPGAGRYDIRVSPRDPMWEGRYSLMIEIVPPCPEGDDRFEDNDVSQDATDFMKASQPPPQQGPDGQPVTLQPQQQKGPPVVFARICPGDIDWWTVTDDGTKPAVWVATFDHKQGDLAMTLFDETGLTELASSDTSSPDKNGEAVPLPLAPKAEKPKPDPNNPSTPPEPDDAPAPPPKKLTLRVAGVGDAQNFYLLRLDRPEPQQSDSDSKDKDKDKDGDKDKDQDKDKDKQDQSDKKDKDKDEDQQGQPLQDALDKLDRNPENLEAKESAKSSPRANQRPIKDW